jgi:pimeloyl-ACP methyl ester carboxylesterase
VKVLLLKLVCVILLAVIVGSAFSPAISHAEGTPAATEQANGQKVKIKEPDGLEIVGLYYPAASGKGPAVLLLHDAVATKTQWAPYVASFTEVGYNVLVVDQRGRGETGPGVPTGNPAQQQLGDIPAMLSWLRDQPTVDAESVAIIGARLGANFAIRACATDDKCHVAVALTPSTDFFGIKTADAMNSMPKDKAIFLVAGEYGEQGGQSLKTLGAKASTEINLMTRVYGGATDYGVQMLAHDPTLMPMLLLWLQAYNHG